MRLPKGVKFPGNKTKIAVVLDTAVFNDIIERCKKESKQFSDVANEVAKLGLFDLKEAGE